MIVFVLLAVLTPLQEPSPTPVQQLIQEMVELKKETEATKDELKKLRRQDAREKAQRAASTRKRLERQERQAADAKKTQAGTGIVIEDDDDPMPKADRSWFCKWFGWLRIGC